MPDGETGATVEEEGRLATVPSLVLVAGGFFLGVIVASLLAGIAFALTDDVDAPLVLAASFVGLWIPLVGAALFASRRFGTRSARRDLGLAFEWADLGRGVLVGVAGLLAASAVQLALSPFPDLIGTNTNFIAGQAGTLAGTVVVAVSTMFGAPIVEELFFRGLLQRALARIGVAAVVIQAFVFGLIHVTPDEGLGNVGIMLGVGTFGLVLGLAARRFGRLGPSIVGHALFNATAVLPLLFR